jgi:hypothetical protein
MQTRVLEMSTVFNCFSKYIKTVMLLFQIFCHVTIIGYANESLVATLEIRLGTRQLPTQMPRQVTIFHSLPRQKNAEAIPPVVPYKLQRLFVFFA